MIRHALEPSYSRVKTLADKSADPSGASMVSKMGVRRGKSVTTMPPLSALQH